MALLEMKSNLSQIERNPIQKQKESRDVGRPLRVSSPQEPDFKIDTSPFISSPRIPDPINTAQGVNFISNINSRGFTTNRYTTGRETDFILNENGGPIIPQPLYLDIKGDFTTTFSPTNPAFPNTFNRGDSPTPIQRIPLTFDVSSIVQGRLNPTSVSFQSLNSRLNQLHISGRDDNNGFTRPALSLNEYYLQSRDNSGRFGIRNSRLFDAKQPFIIRAVNQRWGKVSGTRIFSENITNAAQSLSTARNARGLPLGPSVSSRDPNVFESRYEADKIRLSSFIEKGSVFLQRQRDLQRQNTFDRVTTVKYGLTDIDTGNPLIDFLGNSTPIGDLAAQNPKVYNKESVYSIPGVGGRMYNRIGTNTTGLFDGSQIEGLRDQATGILSNITLRALELSTPALEGIIKKGLGEAGKKIGDRIGKITFGKNTLDESGNQLTKKRSLADRFNSIKNNEKVQDISKKIKGANEVRKQAGLLFGFEKGGVSKKALNGLNREAFQDLNVDKVNLIPLGSEKYDEISYEDLDWIPFKFLDVRANKPIVFRAILSGITDTFTPEYSGERYVGRPDQVYVYQGTDRGISFTFDVYPKSDTELPILWDKMNYLAGLTYPHIDNTVGGMVAPFVRLTIGDMYRNAPGIISGLTFAVQDNGTWETDFMKCPKYIQVSCEFNYIGDRLPTAGQKHFDVPNVASIKYERDTSLENLIDKAAGKLSSFLGLNTEIDLNKVDKEEKASITNNAASAGTA